MTGKTQSGDNSVHRLLDSLVADGYVWILCEESGKAVCLFTGKVALMRLRCASPMLEKYNAAVTVYDALQTVQYRINYDMPLIIQEAVLTLHDTDMKSNVGKHLYTIPLKEVTDLQITNGLLAEIFKGYSFKFTYDGFEWKFKNCAQQKEQLEVIKSEVK